MLDGAGVLGTDIRRSSKDEVGRSSVERIHDDGVAASSGLDAVTDR
jgi:hypothetical protein